MQIIDEGTVELTDTEMQAFDTFQAYLDKGLPIPEATDRVRKRFALASLSTDFYRWLGGGIK